MTKKPYESIHGGARHDATCACQVCSRITARRKRDTDRGIVIEINAATIVTKDGLS